MYRCSLLKNRENVEEFTNIRRIFTAVVRHANTSYYDCEDSTKIIEHNCFVKNPRKLVKNPGKLVKNLIVKKYNCLNSSVKLAAL